MEFAQGRRRREGYNFCEADEDQEDSSAAAAAAAPSSWGPPAPEAPSSSSPPMVVEKEHMFDKIVTPSDVGKLNRLVIPKQHAEKYFPLDTSVNEKGLLLNFEDRTGKAWRFRYSYWNSSQSYVMTKGWSRFVKEKRLDAGDTVSFGRGVDDKDRLFIDWKRRPEIHHETRLPRIPLPIPQSNYSNYNYHHPMVSFSRSAGPWAGRLLVPQPAPVHHRQNYVYNAAGGGGSGGGSQYLVFRSAGVQPQQVVQLGSGFHGGDQDGTVGIPIVLDSVPVVQSQAAAKRVRLFGVNLDFPDTSDGDAGDSSIRSQASSPSMSKGKEKEEELSLDLDM